MGASFHLILLLVSVGANPQRYSGIRVATPPPKSGCPNGAPPDLKCTKDKPLAKTRGGCSYSCNRCTGEWVDTRCSVDGDYRDQWICGEFVERGGGSISRGTCEPPFFHPKYDAWTGECKPADWECPVAVRKVIFHLHSFLTHTGLDL